MNARTLGKILGALGLVALLSAPYTYFVTTGSPWMAATKAVLGLLLVGAYFATNLGEFGQFASRRSTFYLVSTVATVLVVLAGLVAVNYVVAKKGKSWDLTAKKIFTLAPQTRSTLAALPEKVTVYAFLAPTDQQYESVARLLEQYRTQAPGKFEVVFKDPRKAPDLAQKYQLREAQTTLVLTRGSGEKETHTSVSVSRGVSEQDLTNALIKLNAVGEQKVYFTTGHGEWPLEPADQNSASLKQLSKSLFQDGYLPSTLNLADGKQIPKDAALVVVAGAHSAFAKGERDQLAKYLEQGGRLLYFAEAGSEPGLEGLLATYGVQVDPGLVAEYVEGIESPYLIISDAFGDTPLARDLKRARYNLQFPMVRGLTALRTGLAPDTKVEPVVLTAPTAFEVKTPTELPRPEDGGKAGSIPLILQSTRPVGGAVEGKRNDEMRLLVFGTAQNLADQNWGNEPNRNMILNAFAWATSQVQKITIRPPDRDISTVDLDASRLARIRFLATDLVPFGLLGVGLAIWLNRRSK